MEPAIITCAVTGGMTVPSQSAAIPVTPEQIIDSAVEAHAAGAAIVHIHVRDPETGRPVADAGLFGEVMSAIAERCDVIVQPTTGGGIGMTIDERAAVLTRYEPEMASFNTGSLNFALFQVLRGGRDFERWEVDYLESSRDYVFRNTFQDMEMLAERFRAAGTKPECEAYDVGHLYNLHDLYTRGLLDEPLHVQFVLGVLGGNAARLDQLMHMHRTARELFGDSLSWSVAGIGYPAEFHLGAAALMLGGHMRVGLEDNLRVTGTRRAASNAELVERAIQLAELLDRRPASAAEARGLLRLKGRAGTAIG